MAAGFLQGSLRLAARTAAAFHDDADGALLELLVAGLDVDHEVAVDLAELDHRARREHVEHELLCRARLHARRARDDFRPRDGRQRDVSKRGNLGVFAARQCNRQRAERFGIVEPPNHVGRAA